MSRTSEQMKQKVFYVLDAPI